MQNKNLGLNEIMFLALRSVGRLVLIKYYLKSRMSNEKSANLSKVSAFAVFYIFDALTDFFIASLQYDPRDYKAFRISSEIDFVC